MLIETNEALQVALQVAERIRKSRATLASDLVLGLNDTWHHASVQPQAVIDKYGANAVKVFEITRIAIELVAASYEVDGLAIPNDLAALLPVPAHTINADGTVTVG